MILTRRYMNKLWEQREEKKNNFGLSKIQQKTKGHLSLLVKILKFYFQKGFIDLKTCTAFLTGKPKCYSVKCSIQDDVKVTL